MIEATAPVALTNSDLTGSSSLLFIICLANRNWAEKDGKWMVKEGRKLPYYFSGPYYSFTAQQECRLPITDLVAFMWLRNGFIIIYQSSFLWASENWWCALKFFQKIKYKLHWNKEYERRIYSLHHTAVPMESCRCRKSLSCGVVSNLSKQWSRVKFPLGPQLRQRLHWDRRVSCIFLQPNIFRRLWSEFTIYLW